MTNVLLLCGSPQYTFVIWFSLCVFNLHNEQFTMTYDLYVEELSACQDIASFFFEHKMAKKKQFIFIL